MSAWHPITVKGFRLGLAILGGLLLAAVVLFAARVNSRAVYAGPIAPPEGYPKFSLSAKTVTPTLAHAGGVTLTFAIAIRNTGAYTATGVKLTDTIPDATTYNGDARASVAPTPTVVGRILAWTGDVGFDSTVVVSFSVAVSPAFTGTIRNTAVISHPLIARPVSATVETVVTDQPILAIAKTSTPPKPGANKPLAYTIVITNQGQPAVNLPITVTDRAPFSTTLRSIGPGGFTSPISDVITWTRRITLDLGGTTAFTFSVNVGSVPSGTIISNASYQVNSPVSGVTAGKLYTVTIVDPILSLSKSVWPDPPGSNREMTYTLTLLNMGSLATGLVITDRVPQGVTYVRGGVEASGVVSWSLPRLDTGESAGFTYTVYISDVMNIPIVNSDYRVCSAEKVCLPGVVLTSVVGGPTFQASAVLDPIAKKPGGGGGPVTPTLVVRNLGPGNAIDATAILFFTRISVSANDLYAIPAIGTLPPFPNGPICGSNCVSYVWVGSLGAGQAVTFTTITGQNTIGGEEGTIYTATVVMTDSLSNMNTAPITGTATGKVTHYANVLPTKSAPPVIGRGQLMTYTINVWNSALSTALPPVLTDTVPLSTTFVWASDGGVTRTLIVSGSLPRTVISWTLPSLGPGAAVNRLFTVRVNDNLVSGTQIVNRDYAAFGYGNVVTGALTSGPPVTTTVQDVGLIDSFKVVTPTLALPGPGNVLTYSLHIVNSSALSLTGVTAYDLLPWQASTYRRDAIASAGQIMSDIVSIRWQGDVAAFSSEVVTLTVLVDPDYRGAITNTAIISHPDLLNEVVVRAVTYITERPELRIIKSASPDPVARDSELEYTIGVVNLGQQATSLVITDVIPANTQYVMGSATANGQLIGDQVRWEIPVLKPGESRTVTFRVKVGSGSEVVNGRYAVMCAEGVTAVGAPVVTRLTRGNVIYLPIVMRNAP